MLQYTFQRIDATETTVTARDEISARRKAMIALWGTIPDEIIPHAPEYQGLGLSLLRKV